MPNESVVYSQVLLVISLFSIIFTLFGHYHQSHSPMNVRNGNLVLKSYQANHQSRSSFSIYYLYTNYMLYR